MTKGPTAARLAPAPIAPAAADRERAEAGLELAAELREYASQDPLVLALPRGGVPVAALPPGAVS